MLAPARLEALEARQVRLDRSSSAAARLRRGGHPKGRCGRRACRLRASPGYHTCVRRTVLGPPTSHVLSLHRGGALGGAAWVLETSLAVQLKVLLEVRGQTDTAEVRAWRTWRAWEEPSRPHAKEPMCNHGNKATPSARSRFAGNERVSKHTHSHEQHAERGVHDTKTRACTCTARSTYLEASLGRSCQLLGAVLAQPPGLS